MRGRIGSVVRRQAVRWVVIALTLASVRVPAPVAADNIAPGTAVVFADAAFRGLWRRTDELAEGKRGYLWGPADAAKTIVAREPYADAPGGSRLVEYFDKTRMERTNPAASRASAAFVTNGLLAKELITGKLQLGNTKFEERQPAAITIAGDANDTDGPTYATFTELVSTAPLAADAPITQTVDRAGKIGTGGPGGVTAGELVTQTNHRTASVFRDFIFGSGPVLGADGKAVNAPLFANGYAGGVGFPLTEAYWAKVRVGGVAKQVLVQAFERRVLTYTPDNPDGFKVEAGNVGEQYRRWRYGKETPPAPGSRVAVAGKSGGKPAVLVVADADGKRRTVLADPAGDVRALAWSPDGLAIAYVSSGKIYRAALDDNKITKLTDGSDDDSPAWSPDGTRLAFAHGSDLAVLNLAADSMDTLFAGNPGIDTVAWSPDSTHLAFTRGASIWTMGADGFDLTLALTGTGGTLWQSPGWTPDGTRLVATRVTGGTSTIVLASADGGTTRDLVTGTAGTLSPDGERLLAVGAGGRVIVTDARGYGSRPFTPDGTTDAFPAWSPT